MNRDMLKYYAAIAITCTSVFANTLPIYAQAQSPITTTINSSAKLQFDRGVAKFESGDTAGAIKDFTATIDLDPKYADAYIYRGIIQGIQSQKPDLAIRDLDRAIQLDPKNSNAYTFRGFTKFISNPTNNFRSDLDRAIQLNPQSQLNYFVLITAAKHNEQDLRQFAKLLRQNPNIFYYNLLLPVFPSPADKNPRQFDTRTLTTAKAYVERGLDRLEDEKIDKHNINAALADFDRAVTLDPQNSDAYFYRSLFSSSGNLSNSHVDIDRAIAINPQPEQYYFLRGMLRMSGNPYAVRKDLDRAIAINPQSYLSLGFRGLVKSSMLSEAAAGRVDALAAAKLARQNGNVGEYFGILLFLDFMTKDTAGRQPDLLKLAVYQYRAGDRQAALANLAKIRIAKNQQPKKDAQTYNDLANAGIEMGDLTGATIDINTAIKTDPKSISSLFVLAEIKTKLNDKPGAIAALDRIMAISTKPLEPLGVANYKFDRLGNARSALVDLKKAIVRYPKSAAIYYRLSGEIKAKTGDKQGAAADHDRSIDSKPDFAYSYIVRAKFKAEHLRDKAGAFADYEQAIRLDPKVATSAYLERGNTKRQFKDFVGAMADYQRAIAVGDNSVRAEAYTEQANLHRDYLKDFPRALADYDRAIDLDSIAIRPYYFRATLRHQLNDKIGAIADYRSTIERIEKYDSFFPEHQDLGTRSLNALKQLNATQD